jgi:ubiquinone/menaquinone biosynthesis C-methylase UbiE
VKEDSTRIGKRYSSYAAKYKQLFHNDHGDDCYLNLLANYLALGSKILDIGCGSGRDIKTMRQKGFLLTGIDISKKMLELSAVENPDSPLYFMDVTSMEFGEKSFDAIYCFFVLEHLTPKNFKLALQEIRRVLKPNGYFLLVQHDAEVEKDMPDLMTDGKKNLFRYMIPLNKLKTVLKDFGFNVLFTDSRRLSDSTTESADKELAIIMQNVSDKDS